VLTEAQLRILEERLRKERERTLRALGRFQELRKLSRDVADADLTAYSMHMADQGTDAMEREQAYLMASKEGRYLYRIEEALRRLYNEPERFGLCQGCGQPIPFERLEALPHVRYCLQCKLQEEAA